MEDIFTLQNLTFEFLFFVTAVLITIGTAKQVNHIYQIKNAHGLYLIYFFFMAFFLFSLLIIGVREISIGLIAIGLSSYNYYRIGRSVEVFRSFSEKEKSVFFLCVLMPLAAILVESSMQILVLYLYIWLMVEYLRLKYLQNAKNTKAYAKPYLTITLILSLIYAFLSIFYEWYIILPLLSITWFKIYLLVSKKWYD